MKRHICSEKGFSLIELLVALTIFAVGLLALAGMQLTGIQGNSRAQSVSAKVALADAVIEEFLAMDGDDSNLTTEITSTPWEIMPGVTSMEIEGAGTCSVEVTVVVDPDLDGAGSNPPLEGLTQINVVASSTTGADVEKTIMKRRY